MTQGVVGWLFCGVCFGLLCFFGQNRLNVVRCHLLSLIYGRILVIWS